MLKRLIAALLLMPLLALPSLVFAQTVPGTINITWPAATLTMSGVPLSGAYAVTSIQVFLSTSPIPDNSTAQPTATIGPNLTATSQTLQVADGQTIYARLKFCNAPGGCGPFTNQGTKLISLDNRPMPTSITIELKIQP